MNNLSPPLFNISDLNWQEYLDNNGYVVFKDILSEEKKQSIFNQFKLDLNTVSPNFDFNDYNTWNINNTPCVFNKGMCVYNGFGQSDFMWMLRQDKNIQSIYKHLYSTDDLITSFDGFSLYVSSKQVSKPWLHVDQNSNNKILSFQGQYNFFKVDNDDAGFVIIPKSHINYSYTSKDNKDWHILEKNELDNLDTPIKLLMPENCFTIWNSKLVHANTFSKKKEITSINRLTAYVTYLPRSLQTQSSLEERIEGYKNSVNTSHWANKCDIKKYPWGFGPRYESRGFKNINPKLIDSKIPIDRLELI